MIRSFLVLGAACGSLLFSNLSEAQRHAGKMDTDGHLSPGELRNPRIDYGDRHRHGYGHGYGYGYGHDRHDDYRYRYPEQRYPTHYNGGHWGNSGYTASVAPVLLNGVRSGRLSRREEWELRDIAEDLRRREDEYRRDGRLTRWEHDDLIRREDSFRKKLEHELYDGEKRW